MELRVWASRNPESSGWVVSSPLPFFLSLLPTPPSGVISSSTLSLSVVSCSATAPTWLPVEKVHLVPGCVRQPAEWVAVSTNPATDYLWHEDTNSNKRAHSFAFMHTQTQHTHRAYYMILFHF